MLGSQNSHKCIITILVNSCDLYEDAWYPFFYLLRKHWPACNYNIVLNTETKQYHDDYFNIKTINTGTELSWTARLRYVLNKIDTEYVLFFLEDFFLITDVKQEAFDKAVELISNNKDIGLIHFTPSEKTMPVPKYDLDNCFYELPVKKRTLRTRVAVSLFRKDYFLKLLYGDENPWQYERESHIRSMFAGYKIYRQSYELYPPTFTYFIDASIGVGITAKKWLSNNEVLFLSEGIKNVNLESLGTLPSDYLQQKANENKQIKRVGVKQWVYSNIKHPIKKKIRHVWFIQDFRNRKKYKKWREYYKNYDSIKSE